MDPKKLLFIVGLGFLVVSLLGVVGLFGPEVGNSVFGKTWWQDPAENVAYLIIGLVSIVAAFKFNNNFREAVLYIFGIGFIVVSIVSIFTNHFYRINIEYPTGTILYFSLGNVILLNLILGRMKLIERQAKEFEAQQALLEKQKKTARRRF